MNDTFLSFNLSPSITKALETMGFETATPIQSRTIPAVKSGKDLIAKSQTGTGKTAAFAIPMLEALDLYEAKQTIQALILCPTRELALQVTDEIRSISRYMEHVQPVAIYGGAPIDKQCINLRRCNVVIGTPGRVLDHIKRKTIKFKSLKMLVLDEADEMLSMGFKDELESILTNLPKERQTLLFSATIPPAILDISKKYLNDPEKIEIEPEKMTLDNIEQIGRASCRERVLRLV